MVWTEITRPQYRRDGLRYASDTIDAEWTLIAPLCRRTRRLGRPRTTALRAVVEAIFYLAETGCQWRMLPKDFPPYTTVQRYFYRWRDDGTWERINHTAGDAGARGGRPRGEPIGRGDRQPVGQDHRGGRPPRVRRRQEDQGPQTPPRHRYAGNLVGAIVHAADIQDRDGAADAAGLDPPRLSRGCAMSSPMAAMPATKLRDRPGQLGRWTIEIVKRSDRAKGFSCCLAAGWSSEPSPGSTATAASPRTSRPRSKAPKPGS